MIFWTAPYDPEEDEGRRRPAHITSREVKIILVVIVLAAVLLYPVYLRLMDDRNRHVCRTNLGNIGKALQFYAEANNDRLPPLYVTSVTGYEPRLFEDGPFTWISLIAPYIREGGQNTFACPAGHDDELVRNENAEPDQPAIPSNYGMFAGLSAMPRSSISNPSQTVLVSETSNRGARNTYNPIPFRAPHGQPIPDGFHIGFDTSNFTPLDNSPVELARAQAATRLAFPNTSNGRFQIEGGGRHPGVVEGAEGDLHIFGVHVLYPDLQVRFASRRLAIINRLEGGEIVGAWAVR
jgi:hypothetical protein